MDRTLLIENLKLTPNERSRKFEHCIALADALRLAGREVPRWPLLDLAALEKAHGELRQSRDFSGGD